VKAAKNDMAAIETDMRTTLVLALFIETALAIQLPARADTKVIVSYTQVDNQVTPTTHEFRNNRRTIIVLTNDKKIRTGADINGSHSLSAIHELNVPIFAHNQAGVEYVIRYSIENGQIVVASFLPSYKIITRISTDGKSKCSATREYKLLPGHRVFEDKDFNNKQDVTMSNVHAEDVTCDISELSP
jgi:hypothetical protein